MGAKDGNTRRWLGESRETARRALFHDIDHPLL